MATENFASLARAAHCITSGFDVRAKDLAQALAAVLNGKRPDEYFPDRDFDRDVASLRAFWDTERRGQDIDLAEGCMRLKLLLEASEYDAEHVGLILGTFMASERQVARCADAVVLYQPDYGRIYAGADSVVAKSVWQDFEQEIRTRAEVRDE